MTRTVQPFMSDTWEHTATVVGSLVAAIAAGVAAYRKWGERAFGNPQKTSEKTDMIQTIDDAIAYRAELRAEIRELNARCDVLSDKLELERQLASQLGTQVAIYRAESLLLRERYHNLINWAHAHGTFEEDIPPWLTERVPGPTENDPWRRREGE